jgi:hypothetical protein
MRNYVVVVGQRSKAIEFAMAYRVVKTVKGRRYIYEQRTWREGTRVRTESRYIGPADGWQKRRRLARKITGFIKANMTPRQPIIDEEQILKDYNERAARVQQGREALLGELHDKYGLRVADTPRPAVAIPQTAAVAAPTDEPNAKESPSNNEGQEA